MVSCVSRMKLQDDETGPSRLARSRATLTKRRYDSTGRSSLMEAGSEYLSGSRPAAKKLHIICEPAGIFVVWLPSVKVVASGAMRLAPEAPGYRRNLFKTVLSLACSRHVSACMKAKYSPLQNVFTELRKVLRGVRLRQRHNRRPVLLILIREEQIDQLGPLQGNV